MENARERGLLFKGGCESPRKLGRLALGGAHAGSEAKTRHYLSQSHIMSLTCSQSLNSFPLVAKAQTMSKQFETAHYLGPLA